MNASVTAGLIVAGFIILIVGLTVLVVVFGRRRDKQVRLALETKRAADQAAELARRQKELDSLTDKTLLFQIRLALEKDQDIQQAQLKHLGSIATAANLWLALMVLALVGGLLIWLLG